MAICLTVVMMIVLFMIIALSLVMQEVKDLKKIMSKYITDEKFADEDFQGGHDDFFE